MTPEERADFEDEMAKPSELSDLWPGRYLDPMDLGELFRMELPDEPFMVEPILPRGRQVSIVATRGDGKSLLALDVACAVATGRAILHQPATGPRHVGYLDMEMGAEDLLDRLEALGYDPDGAEWPTLIEHLHYFQLIDLPPLDTEEGGQVLEALVDRWAVELLVIDTMSRVISKGENDNDTWLNLEANAGRRLKRQAVTVLRLDHFGKDKEKGARGGSAKDDFLDVVWHLDTTVEGLRLRRAKGRQNYIPELVHITRESDPVVRHVTPPEFIPPHVSGIAANLEELGVPIHATVADAADALRGVGLGRRKAEVAAAVKYRKRGERREPPGNRPSEPIPEPSGTTEAEPATNQQTQGVLLGTETGTTADRHREPNPPYKKRGLVPSPLPEPPRVDENIADLGGRR